MHIAILLLLISRICFADLASPFMFSNQKQLRLSNMEYTRYVRPQLKTMTNEFFDLFKEFDNSQKELVKVHRLFGEMRILVDKCEKQKQDLSCKNILSDLTSLLKRIEVLLYQIDEKHLNDSKLLFIRRANYIKWVNQYYMFLTLNFETQNLLKEISARESDVPFEIIKTQLHLNEVSFYPLMTISLPIEKQTMFSNVLKGFFLPIEQRILINDNYDYLIQNAEALNFVWNQFNMKLTKSNLEFKNSTKSLSTQIHRRWVSVLKILLR